jgi:tetratricopeptide (TPR) repeat protein
VREFVLLGLVGIRAAPEDRAQRLAWALTFETQYRAAQVALQLDRWDEAEGHLRRAISLRPEFGPALLNRGVLFLKRGDTDLR